MEWSEIVNAYIDGWRNTGKLSTEPIFASRPNVLSQVTSQNAEQTQRSECRVSSARGDDLSLHDIVFRAYVQGGDDGMPILGDFAVKYSARAAELGVPTDDLYQALVDTAENTVRDLILFRPYTGIDFALFYRQPPNWYEGLFRQLENYSSKASDFRFKLEGRTRLGLRLAISRQTGLIHLEM